jgi:hypothetical protein
VGQHLPGDSGDVIADNLGKYVDDFDIETQAEVGKYDITVVKPDATFMAAIEERTKYAQDAWLEKAAARLNPASTREKMSVVRRNQRAGRAA